MNSIAISCTYAISYRGHTEQSHKEWEEYNESGKSFPSNLETLECWLKFIHQTCDNTLQSTHLKSRQNENVIELFLNTLSVIEVNRSHMASIRNLGPQS